MIMQNISVFNFRIKTLLRHAFVRFNPVKLSIKMNSITYRIGAVLFHELIYGNIILVQLWARVVPPNYSLPC